MDEKEFWTTVKASVSAAAKTIEKTGKEIIEKSKLSIEIAKIKMELKEDFETLGRNIYEDRQKGEIDSEKLEDLTIAINKKEKNLNELLDKQEKAKKTKECSSCGKFNEKDAVYCSGCGQEF